MTLTNIVAIYDFLTGTQNSCWRKLTLIARLHFASGQAFEFSFIKDNPLIVLLETHDDQTVHAGQGLDCCREQMSEMGLGELSTHLKATHVIFDRDAISSTSRHVCFAPKAEVRMRVLAPVMADPP